MSLQDLKRLVQHLWLNAGYKEKKKDFIISDSLIMSFVEKVGNKYTHLKRFAATLKHLYNRAYAHWIYNLNLLSI